AGSSSLTLPGNEDPAARDTTIIENWLAESHRPANTDRQKEERAKTVAALQAVIPHSPFNHLLAQVLNTHALQNPDTLTAAQQADAALRAGRDNTPQPLLGQRAEQILDQLTQRALTDRAQTALSTETDPAFPPDPAQRRTTLLNAAARAADEGVIGWLPADLLWLYTEKGIQARLTFKITVTRAGIIRNFAARKIGTSSIQPFIRALRKTGANWYVDSEAGWAGMEFSLGKNGSLPYVLHGPTKANRSAQPLKYEDPEALLPQLADDHVLKALAPDAHLVLMMWTDTGSHTHGVRNLAWNAAAEYHRVVDFATVNSRLSDSSTGGGSFGLEMTNGELWTAEQIKKRWEQVTPQKTEEAGYGLLREMLGEAISNDPALLARVRPSVVRWADEAATESDKHSSTIERLDRLADYMLPERVQEAFNKKFPPDAQQRRQVLLNAAVQAAKEGVADWLPADLLWFYTDTGVEARKKFNVTVTKAGIVRNFSSGKMDELKLRPGIRGLRKPKKHWTADQDSATADSSFLLGANGSLPYLLHGPAQAGLQYRFPYANPDKLLKWLEDDSVLKALAPDAHLVLVMWAKTDTLRNGLNELARNAAEKLHRIVDLSTVNTRISRIDPTGSWIGLEAPNGAHWTEQEIRETWKFERPQTHAQPNSALLTEAAQGASSSEDSGRRSAAAFPAQRAADASEDSTVDDAMDIDTAVGRGESDSVNAMPEREEAVAALPAVMPNSLHPILAQVLGAETLQNHDILEAARQVDAALEARQRNAPDIPLGALAVQILDHLMERSLPERVQTAFSSDAFPTEIAQRRVLLFNALVRAAEEDVAGWLPSDLLWLYTEQGVRARQELNVTVTRSGIIRNFSTGKVKVLLPGIRVLHPRGTYWFADRKSERANSASLFGMKGSLPYLLHGPIKATASDHESENAFRYRDLEEFLLRLEDDRILKALPPQAHLVLAMWADTGPSGYGIREVAWDVAAVHGHVVNFSTVNSRLIRNGKGNHWLGLEVPGGELRSEDWILQHWKVVTPQRAESAGDRLVRALPGVAAGRNDALLSGVRQSLVRWASAAGGKDDTDARAGKRLEWLAERMLPEHVRNAFGDVFPADAGGRREVLRSAVVRAVEEGVAGWLPARLLWLYTDEGTRARRELNVTVTRAGVVRDFSSAGDVRELRPFIRGLHEDGEGNWLADEGSASISSGFWAARDGSLPYLLLGPARATDDGHPIPDTSPQRFLQQLADDRVLKAMAPDAHLVLVTGNSYGLGELAMAAAAAHGRVVDYSTAGVSVSARSPHGQQWLGLRLPPATHVTAQDIRQQWTSVSPHQASQQHDAAAPAPPQTPQQHDAAAPAPPQTSQQQDTAVPALRRLAPRRDAAASAPLQTSQQQDTAALARQQVLRRRDALVRRLLGEAVLAEPGVLSVARQAVGVLQDVWQREQRGQSAGEPLSQGVFDELTARVLGIRDAGTVWETDRLRLVKLVTDAASENRADSIDQLTAYALRSTVSTDSSRILPRPPRTTAPTNITHTATGIDTSTDISAGVGSGTGDGAGAGGENGDDTGAVAGVRHGDVADGDVVFVAARPAAEDVRGGDVWRGGARFWLSRSTLKRVGQMDLSHVHVQSYVYTDEVRSEVLSPAVVAPWAAEGLPAPFVAAFHLLPGQDAQLVVPRRTPVTVPVKLLVELLAMDPLLADAPDNTPIVLLNPAGPATRVARALARRLPGRRVWSATGYSDLTTTSTIQTDTSTGTGAGASVAASTGTGDGTGAGGGVLRIVLVERTDVPESMRPPLGQWTLEHRPPVIVIPETPRPGTPSPSPAEHAPPHTDIPMDDDAGRDADTGMHDDAGMDAYADGAGEADMEVLFPGLSSIRFSPGMNDSMADEDLSGFLNSLGDLPDPDDDTLWDASDVPPDTGMMTGPPPAYRGTDTNADADADADAGSNSGEGFIPGDWMDLDALETDDEFWDIPGITGYQTTDGDGMSGLDFDGMPPVGRFTTGPHPGTGEQATGADRMDLDPALTAHDNLAITPAVTDDQAPNTANPGAGSGAGVIAVAGTSDVPPDTPTTTSPHPEHPNPGTDSDFQTGFEDNFSFTDLMDMDFDLTGLQGEWADSAVTDNPTLTNASSSTAGISGHIQPDPAFTTGPHDGTPDRAGDSTNPHSHSWPPPHPDELTPTTGTTDTGTGTGTGTGTQRQQIPPVFIPTSDSTGPHPGTGEQATGANRMDLDPALPTDDSLWTTPAVTDDQAPNTANAVGVGTTADAGTNAGAGAGVMPGLRTGDVPPDTPTTTSPHPEHPNPGTDSDVQTGFEDNFSFTDLMDMDFDLTGLQGEWPVNDNPTPTDASSGTAGIPGHMPPDPAFTTGPYDGTADHAGDSTNPHSQQPPAHPDEPTPTTGTTDTGTGTGTQGQQIPPVFIPTSDSTGLFDGEPVTLGRPGQGPTGLIDSLLQALRTTTPNTTIDPDTL
ncbi:hypothetical protein ACIP10_36995, partial [Streptomyces galbus]